MSHVFVVVRMDGSLLVFVVAVSVVREGAGWAVCFAPRLLRIRMSLQHTTQPTPSLTTWASLLTQHWSMHIV
jgi:hypothetical protein